MTVNRNEPQLLALATRMILDLEGLLPSSIPSVTRILVFDSPSSGTGARPIGNEGKIATWQRTNRSPYKIYMTDDECQNAMLTPAGQNMYISHVFRTIDKKDARHLVRKPHANPPNAWKKVNLK